MFSKNFIANVAIRYCYIHTLHTEFNLSSSTTSSETEVSDEDVGDESLNSVCISQ